MKTVKVLGLKPSEMPGKVLAMPVNCPRNLQPTVEHVEESEIETIESPQARRLSKSYFDSSLVSSDDSMASTPDEEIPTPPRASLCRRDVAHEIATSLWGLVPPKNFDLVMPSVYRCSFPQTENFPFLKSLGLKTIL
ncbi:MAG: hypothetical protein M1831_003300 [Alyxoria varia]|nr:MAG: hypothetical protein M1831_003300 [Alyxoria varia]